MRRYEAKKKHINNFMTHLNLLSISIIQVLVYAAVSSEDGMVKKNGFLNRDRWRDLLMITDFEAIKHELIFL
jgi:hypothetical protein